MKQNNPGCCPCSSTCNGTVRARVFECGTTSAGVTVTIKQGSTTLGSGTTDSGGYYPPLSSAALAMPSAGSYSADTPAAGRYAAGTITQNLNCSTNVLTINPAPLASYVCCGSCGAWPVAQTVTLADPFGNIPLAYDASVFSGSTILAWKGCALRTVSGQILDSYGNCTSATVTTPVVFRLCCGQCGGTGTDPWRLQLTFPTCFDSNFSTVKLPTNDTCANFIANGAPGLGTEPVYISSTCDPLALTFKMVSPFPATAAIYPNNSMFSVTE